MGGYEIVFPSDPFLFIHFDSGRKALDPPTPLARNETLFCFLFHVLGFDPGSGQPPPSLPRGGAGPLYTLPCICRSLIW